MSERKPRLGDRTLFGDLEPFAYLNHAAISPPSSLVVTAIEEVIAHYTAGGLAALRFVLPQRERLRGKVARLIGAQDDEIGFTPNTTSAISTAALCFPWERGDGLVVLDGEFPANVTAWRQAAELYGLRVHTIAAEAFGHPDPERGLASLDAALADGARLAAVSAVQFQTGLRMPLRAIADRCHAAGAYLFVDGIQAIGANPFDVRALGIDMLGSGAHKWLMGIEGAGFFYVRRELAPKLRPVTAGWLSHEDPVGFLIRGPGQLDYDRPIRKDASFVERGSASVLSLAAMEAAVDTIAHLQPSAIHEHVQRYLDPLENGLVSRGFASLRSPDAAERSCLLCLLPPDDHSVVDLAHRLEERGVAVSTPDGTLRFSPHWPNDLREVARIFAAIDEVL